jgi:hypothetical protein
VSSRQPCFLSNPEWRALLDTSADEVASGEDGAFILRADLCNFLLDVLSIITEVSSISRFMKSPPVNFVDTTERVERAVFRTLSIKKAIESWYNRQVEPRFGDHFMPCASFLVANQDDDVAKLADDGKRQYPNLLFAVVVCVSNSMVIRLDTLLSTLVSLSPYKHDEVDLGISPSTTAQRQDIVHQSLHFVKRTSSVAAKPLSFGLQQLWFSDASWLEVFDEYGDRQISSL